MQRRRRRKRRKRKKSEAEAHGLEKPQVLRGLIAVEDGSVAVDLPNLGSQHVFILIVFSLPGIIGLEIYCNNTAPSQVSESPLGWDNLKNCSQRDLVPIV